MLIATLPTIRSDSDFRLAENIFGCPAIGSARYNTGGETPLEAKEIITRLARIATSRQKILYVDLEGRQTRVAAWSPFARGCVVLNREFEIELPAQIYFRRAGWCKVVNAEPKQRKLYFESSPTSDYYLGAGQSVHIVAKKFRIPGYLGGRDMEFIDAARSESPNFMLSFIEELADLEEFDAAFGEGRNDPKVVLKIESPKGVEFISKYRRLLGDYRLMAARDDLFLGYLHRRGEILQALKKLVEVDADAIVASRLLTGLERNSEPTLADIEDVFLMHSFGYKHFMFADELSDRIREVARVWEDEIKPNLKG